MLTLDKFEEASEKVKEVTLETKLVYSDFLSEQTQNKVYLKPENMQFTGAYKVRGAYYKISTLSDEEREKGLITASAGNHAQGVAYAARCYGCKATIVMPTTTPLIKVNRTKSYGANVVLFGDVYDEAYAKAMELAEENGYTFIHPFDDLAVATGQGTIAMEIFKELPLVEYILVPIGGGGLATGVSTLAKLLNPKIKVIGVEPAGASCMKASFEAGKVTTLPGVNTIADGTAVKTPGATIFPYIKQNLDDIITIEDDELIVAFLDMVENHKMVVENSGLLTVAALKHLGVKGKRVVYILSGGNMDVITMSSVVQQGLIFRDRIFTVSVLLPDKPGELAKVSNNLAKQQGNVIKLEHNQFVSTNRSAAVELRITLECFGTDHKNQILDALEKAGYKPKVVRTAISEEKSMSESMKDFEKELERSFREIKEGDIISGTVIAVSEEEVTLDLNYYTQGIIKIENLSNDPDFNVFEEVKEGDEIEGTVVRVDDGHGSIELSKKEANDILAWDKFKELQDNDTVVKVRIKESVPAGVITYLEGIRAFIPASQITSDYVEDTNAWIGKEIEAKIITVDKNNEKLVLSGKAVAREKEADERNHKISMLVPGTVTEGTVESIMPYGAFISLGNGLSGLVHISQICQKRIATPNEVLKEGQKVKVKILNTNDNKISLSMKALEEEMIDTEDAGEVEEYVSGEEVGTGLGALLANIKL